MPFHSPRPPSGCLITQEAESTRYALDTFRLRLLSSDKWAVYDSQGTYLGAVDFIHEVFDVTSHLRLIADRIALAHRVAEAAALDDLDIDL